MSASGGARTGSLYVFEGMDGVGKSTVAEEFADVIDAVYLESPGPGISEIRRYVDSDVHSKQTKFLMYMASNSALSDRIEPQLEAGNDVVLDRYFPTTVVYNEADEVENEGQWREMAEQFDFTEPDQMFYLWTDPETRMERKTDREEVGSTGKDVDEIGLTAAEEEYQKAVEYYDMTSIEAVDGVQNVVEKILEEVNY